MCVSAMCLCQSQATTTHALSVAASLLQGGQDKEAVVGLLRQLEELVANRQDLPEHGVKQRKG